MQVGIGLPNAVPKTSPELLLEWSRRADSGPFSSVGVVDRIRYDSFEPMALLSAVAAITERVRLVTMVVIAPLRAAGVLAKEAATVDALSGGRLVLGLAVGARVDDYADAGLPHKDRGERFSEQLGAMRDAWANDWAGPPLASELGRHGPLVLVGGGSDAALARVARYADGYVHGGGPPRAFQRAAERTRVVWAESGRPGEPKLWAQGYFALGSESEVERGRDYMRDYYGFTGPFAEKIVEQMLTTPQEIVAFAKGYADAGCDELVLFPAVAEVEQLERLQEALAALP